MIDMGMDPNSQPGRGQGNPFEFHFNQGNFEDIFSNFGFGFGTRPMRRNKSFNINVEITLEEVLSGKELNAEVGVPGGRSRVINISIPPGIDGGQQIRYEGMGDDSINGIPPGDLHVNVYVKLHPLFKREGDSLVYEKSISVWDALLGTTINIDTLDGRNIDITVPPGTQPETILSCRGEGLPNMRTRQRGNLLIKIKVSIPKNLSFSQLTKIQQLKDEF
jgi:DnaJ-class molecular chaperone